MGRWIFFALGLGALSVTAQTIAGYGISDPDPNPSFSTRGSTLFSTFAGVPTPSYLINSQRYTDAGLGGFASAGADDFTIPVGQSWRIEEIRVNGGYFNSTPMGPVGIADSVNVYILGNSGELPDTINLSAGAIYALENASFSDAGSGDFIISLPGGVVLGPGTYWLSVQANMEVLTNGQWGWAESATAPNSGMTVGFESGWFQTSNFLIPGCVNAWGKRVTTCNLTVSPPNGTPNEFDLAFELEGNVLTPGVSVNPTTLTTTEDGTGSFFEVVLNAPPSVGTSVSVPIGSPDVTEGLVSTTMLTFSAADWEIPKRVTVMAVDDAIADGNVQYTLSNGPTNSSDPGYDGLAVADVVVTNFDNEIVGILVSPLASLQVSEDGTLTTTIEISANTSPTDDVMVPLSISPPIATLDQAMVVLTGTQPAMVTVTGIDNDIADGDRVFTIVTGDPSSTGDAVYDALSAADVADPTGTVQDDDTAGILVTPNGTAPLTTDETGTTASFQVVLNSEPLFPVTIPVVSSDTSEGVPNDASLTFQPGDWDVPQTVTVTGQDDEIVDGNINYQIMTQAATSNDPGYSGFAGTAIPFINEDRGDAAGFEVTPTTGLVTDENGLSDQFTVRLTSEPLQSVTLPLESDNPGEGVVSPASLMFDALNWNQVQTVTVTGVDDPAFDGDQPYTVVTGDPTSNDPTYNAFDAASVADVAVTNGDNELCAPVQVTCQVGGPMVIEGLPSCVVDVYDTNGSANAANWVLLQAGVAIPASGVVTVPGLVCERDISYAITATGDIDLVLSLFATVPSLQGWGLIALITLLGLMGLFIVRGGLRDQKPHLNG